MVDPQGPYPNTTVTVSGAIEVPENLSFLHFASLNTVTPAEIYIITHVRHERPFIAIFLEAVPTHYQLNIWCELTITWWRLKLF